MQRQPYPLIIAHRGASADHAENSLEAFEAAIAVGADMIEFDVRQTADGELIVYHDDRINGILISDLTRSEIGQLTDHTPPLFDEVLMLANGRIGLDIEIKTAGFVPSIVRALATFPNTHGLFISSFHDEVVMEVKQLRPQLETALLIGKKHKTKRIRSYSADLFPYHRLESLKADYLAPNWTLAGTGLAHRMYGAGYRSMVWTVNDPGRIRTLLQDPAIAGIITDVPDVAIQIRDELIAADA